MTNAAKIEYRIRPVTRYIVTRFESDNSEHPSHSVQQIGVSTGHI